MTISAPISNALTIGCAPKYAFMLPILALSGNFLPENISVGFKLVIQSMLGSRSSPSITATFREIPCSSIFFLRSTAQANGFTPPALEIIFVLVSDILFRFGTIASEIKSVAYPASGSFAFTLAIMAIVISAK